MAPGAAALSVDEFASHDAVRIVIDKPHVKDSIATANSKRIGLRTPQSGKGLLMDSSVFFGRFKAEHYGNLAVAEGS